MFSGVADGIHISDTTYALLDADRQFPWKQCRVDVKGKGTSLCKRAEKGRRRGVLFPPLAICALTLGLMETHLLDFNAGAVHTGDEGDSGRERRLSLQIQRKSRYP